MMPPSSDCTTWVWRDGTTLPLPRFTSSSTAKCAQSRNTTSRPVTVINNIRAVRGVRISMAARTSFENAKSDCDIDRPPRGLRSLRLRTQARQDLIGGTVGDDLAVVEHENAIDQRQ